MKSECVRMLWLVLCVSVCDGLYVRANEHRKSHKLCVNMCVCVCVVRRISGDWIRQLLKYVRAVH